MSGYEVVPCTMADLRGLARNMRAADRSEIIGMGLKPLRTLYHCWSGSAASCAVRATDGAVIAVAGDVGHLLDPVGRLWLFTSPLVERFPLAFFREARAFLHARLAVRRALTSSVRADYTAALRTFDMLGFQIEPPEPMPPYGTEYCRITMGQP